MEKGGSITILGPTDLFKKVEKFNKSELLWPNFQTPNISKKQS